MLLLAYMTVLFLVQCGISESRSLNVGFVIIFDAGSKNTRMSVFSYTKEAFLVIKEEIYYQFGDGGLANYFSTVQIEENFDKAFQEANRVVPDYLRGETMIYLGATAGMRLLEIKSKARSDQILQYVCNYFNATQYLFKSNHQVRILDGAEEAYSSWIAANYLKNTLSASETIGIVELGGSSLQIAFSVSSITNENSFLINVQNTTHSLYSQSFLCFGTTAIVNMYNSFIVRRDDYANNSTAACYPDNYDLTLNQQELTESPCTNGLLFDTSNEFVINQTAIRQPLDITITGTAKKNKCREEMSKIMTSRAIGCNGCSLNEFKNTNTSLKKFIGIGDIYESIYFMEKLLQQDLSSNLTVYDNAIYRLCNMKYSEIKTLNSMNNVGLGKKRMGRLCIENVYILQLLKIFGVISFENLEKLETINENKVNWVLGYALKQVEQYITK